MLPELSGVECHGAHPGAAPADPTSFLVRVPHIGTYFSRVACRCARYVVKEAVSADLVRAFWAVTAGERFLSSQITELVIGGVLGNAETHSPLERLSKREREVLHLTVAGSSSAEIAQRCRYRARRSTPIAAASWTSSVFRTSQG